MGQLMTQKRQIKALISLIEAQTSPLETQLSLHEAQMSQLKVDISQDRFQISQFGAVGGLIRLILSSIRLK